MNTRPRHESSLLHPRHFRQAAALIGLFVLFAFYAVNRQTDAPYATPADMLMAARLYAARQSDGGQEATAWCDGGLSPEVLAARGAVRHLGGDRYEATGRVEGFFPGESRRRRFVAVVLRRRAALVTALPVVEFRFLD